MRDYGQGLAPEQFLGKQHSLLEKKILN